MQQIFNRTAIREVWTLMLGSINPTTLTCRHFILTCSNESLVKK